MGISSWYDMDAEKLNLQGMVDGVVESKVFTIVLTMDYFAGKWCLIELATALVSDKPIVVMYEADTRFGGGHLNDYNIPEQFKGVILEHEILKIDRRMWGTFFMAYVKEMESRLRLESTPM